MKHRPASLATTRDLTSAEQNAMVLALASELLADDRVDVLAEVQRCSDPQFVQTSNPLRLEALFVAASKLRLQACASPLHLTVVWAMYQETARILPRSESEHGEDLVRAKVAQLRWLFDGAGPDQTWDIVACDDGCPESPPSSDVMQAVIDAEALSDRVRVIRLADGIADHAPVSDAFGEMQTTADSRKGGSIAYAIWSALEHPHHDRANKQHVVLYTDADLSSNLAQAGSLIQPIVEDRYASAAGQRYGVPGSILVKEDGAITEPLSTGAKPSRNILLLRHFVRSQLLPGLARVMDTQAGFKAFDAALLRKVLPQLTAFHETFDVELLSLTTHAANERPIALVPILFIEDFALTNFPSVKPGQQHLDMLQQIAAIYAARARAGQPTDAQADALAAFLRQLDSDSYCTLIEQLQALDRTGIDDPRLFDRRWDTEELRRYSRIA